MNNTTKSQVCNVKSGTIITGKWHKSSYKIVRTLGNGANGIVYLAESSKGLVALKISENSMSITSEVNVLKHFSRVRGSALGPSLVDVDDWVRQGKNIPFYVMEYIKGETFLSFIEKRGKEWTGILCLQLLSDLERLHEEGWVFGDLKPDNLIVTGHPPRIRCIDVGGTTGIGRSIKEFTEFFDRGYWGGGSRKAEPSYDLFAVAMIIINSAYPKRFSRVDGTSGMDQLKNVINTNNSLRKYRTVLINSISGHYQLASEMRQDLVISMSKASMTTATTNHVNQTNSRGSGSNSRVNQRSKQKTTTAQQTRTKNRKQKGGGVAETILLLTVVFLGYILYIYGQLL